MQKLLIRKFSFLGMVLIGASAVTAAFVPKNETKKESPRAGTDRLLPSTIGGAVGGQTCVEAADDDCNATSSSTTNANTGGAGNPPNSPTNGTSTSDGGLDGSSAANTTANE